MANREITRSFVHRTFGNIGSVALVAPGGKFTLDGEELPESSVTHLLTFALQTLQDAYAGAESADDAKADWETKRKRLIDGTIGTRGGGGVDEETRVARIVVRRAVKAKFGAKSPEWARFTGLSDDEQNAKLDEWRTANADAFAPAIADEMARRKAEREQRAGLASGVAFDI